MKKTKLTKEEEYALIKEYQTTGDNKSLSKLLNEHMGIIKNRALKMTHGWGDLDALIQEGAIGAMDAIKKFDCDRNVYLSTYIGTCVWGAMCVYVTKQSALNRHSNTEPHDLSWGVENSMLNQPQYSAEISESAELVEEYMNTLTEKQIDCFSVYSLEIDHDGIKQVCEKYNIGSTRVWIIANAVRNGINKVLCLEQP